ncbi:hypothetical protein EJ04DRAFT_261246 [Polyplosphaeria fusca]|uniref:DUF7730 domain-containing protein n=1 Tax=Polyplosphaeria fusca TaxID=682080 RepID=A0A9P4R625_9PLEO|nr:hypothetical protein EJ04DRAFT_261246 [Polyplosphaeria fusca]
MARIAKRKKPATEQYFPFMKLPAELRNAIYEYALVDCIHAIEIEYRSSKLKRHLITRRHEKYRWENDETLRHLTKWTMNERLCTALLLVSKEINAEATGIFYEKNVFLFLNTTAMRHFLRHIGQHILHIRWIMLERFNFTPKNRIPIQQDAFKALIGAVNLEGLILGNGCLNTLSHWNIDGCDAFYRTASSWMWFIAGKKGKQDAAVDMIFFLREQNSPLWNPRYDNMPYPQDIDSQDSFYPRFGTSRNPILPPHKFRQGLQDIMRKL